MILRAPLAAMLTAFLFAGFVSTSGPMWALVFYALVVPLALGRLIRGSTTDWRAPHLLAIGALVLWSTLTLAWGDSAGAGRIWGLFGASLCTALFFAALMFGQEDWPGLSDAVGWVFIIGAPLNALIALAVHQATQAQASRLQGLGVIENPILGALVMGHACLFAIDRFVHSPRWRGVSVLAAVIGFGFIIMSGSRGPLISLAVAAGFLCVGAKPRIWLTVIAGYVVSAAAAAALWVWAPGWTHAALAGLLERGASFRPQIWAFTLRRVAEKPWLGHGLAANLNMPPLATGGVGYSFPHSLYLSALFYSGLVGVALLLLAASLIAGGLTVHAIRTRRPVLLAVWVNVLVGGLTDMGQITNGPGPLWLIVWAPLALAAKCISEDRVKPPAEGLSPPT